MTREQEINLIANCAVPDDKYKEFKDGIIWGAKWADNNPKEDLVSIEKAKIWVRNAFAEYFGNELSNNIADEFIKAMKE